MAFNDAALSAEDRQRVAGFQAAYKTAQAAGDTAGMAAAHQGAEGVRAQYGYSGGASGSGYTPLNSDGSYRATGTYNDAIMNSQHQAQVNALKNAYSAAQKAGDTAGMQAAHNQAEAIRAMYGYSGGTDGSNYIQNGMNTQLPTSDYTTPNLYAGTSLEDKINAVAAAQQEAAVNGLGAAYEQSLADLAEAQRKIPGTYNEARNQTSAQHEIEQHNYGEYAAGNNINTGASSQVRLSQSNAYAGDMNKLNQAQADAVSALELERAKTKIQYKYAVQQAILDGNLQQAQMLYQDAQRVDDQMIQTSLNQANMNLAYSAQRHNEALDQANYDLTRDDVQYKRAAAMAENMAQYGDFSSYKNLGYTDDQINTMTYMWQVLNGFAPASGGGGGSSGGGGGSSSGGSKSGSNSGDQSGPGTDRNKSGTDNTALMNYIANNIPYYVDTTGGNANLSKGLKKSAGKLFKG